MFTLALVDRAGPLALPSNELKLSEGENQNYLVPEIPLAKARRKLLGTEQSTIQLISRREGGFFLFW